MLNRLFEGKLGNIEITRLLSIVNLNPKFNNSLLLHNDMTMTERLQKEGLMAQTLYLNKTLLKKLKAYAVEIDIPFLKLIEPEISKFTEALISKCEQVDEIRRKTLESDMRRKEEQEIVEANPMQVPGHEVNPLENQELEQPITN